jgi:hypothetical protein
VPSDWLFPSWNTAPPNGDPAGELAPGWHVASVVKGANRQCIVNESKRRADRHTRAGFLQLWSTHNHSSGQIPHPHTNGNQVEVSERSTV